MGRLLTNALYWLGLVLFHLRLDGLVRWLGRGNVKVLLYHDVEAHETDYTAGLDCTTRTEAFAAHLDWLRQHYTVVSLETFLAGEAPRRAAVITFDDGYHSVYRNAWPALRERGMPATVYLISGVVDNVAMVWVNELNYWLRAEPGFTRSVVEKDVGVPAGLSVPDVISHCRMNYDPQRIFAALGRIRVKFPDAHQAAVALSQLYVSWDDVREMQQAGMTFGNHTITHPNLERLSDDEQFAEFAGAQDAIGRKIGLVTSLAYPFGHHSGSSADIAARAGLTSIGEVGGANRRLNPMAIGRTHIGDETVAGLFARVEVVEPIKARLRALGG
ncbi:polysaccharide deacetylase family protein [Sphingomonas panacisoli]|uniref:Chitooligosaccharide deacetylase n=1 Tax=Sphingomonas panacisoli TaxID=1813879 RepID=A0A5B8LK77_9SPHN|nr:polysaccharide deacetylase family protein [Sphingomonas panacisoli]QDZ08135.1 polysaccharide deacetylase family protein [Sphingomonas panacisoli]